jgi:hypothetical protein
MWRRYSPKTNCFFDAMPLTNHSPLGGNLNGTEARPRSAVDRMLTNRTISGREGSAPNGFSISIRIRSRPSQSITSASNGNFRSSSARNFARDPGFRTTKVPAAPTFTTSYSLSSLASMLGRNVLCPPTFTPRRKTTRAIAGLYRGISTLLAKLTNKFRENGAAGATRTPDLVLRRHALYPAELQPRTSFISCRLGCVQGCAQFSACFIHEKQSLPSLRIPSSIPTKSC